MHVDDYRQAVAEGKQLTKAQRLLKQSDDALLEALERVGVVELEEVAAEEPKPAPPPPPPAPKKVVRKVNAKVKK